jgi:hypothetical protein
MINYIEPIRYMLDEHLHQHCKMYLKFGVPVETPRYYNFGKFNKETKELTIRSTQKQLGFKIPTDFEFIEVRLFWPQFRSYRSEFLLTHYPSIKTD